MYPSIPSTRHVLPSSGGIYWFVLWEMEETLNGLSQCSVYSRPLIGRGLPSMVELSNVNEPEGCCPSFNPVLYDFHGSMLFPLFQKN